MTKSFSKPVTKCQISNSKNLISLLFLGYLPPVNTLQKIGADFIKVSKKNLISIIAKDLSKGKSVGWFQGRMEFGPRALGNRSILADPRNKSMQKTIVCQDFAARLKVAAPGWASTGKLANVHSQLWF